MSWAEPLICALCPKGSQQQDEESCVKVRTHPSPGQEVPPDLRLAESLLISFLLSQTSYLWPQPACSLQFPCYMCQDPDYRKHLPLVLSHPSLSSECSPKQPVKLQEGPFSGVGIPGSAGQPQCPAEGAHALLCPQPASPTAPIPCPASWTQAVLFQSADPSLTATEPHSLSSFSPPGSACLLTILTTCLFPQLPAPPSSAIPTGRSREMLSGKCYRTREKGWILKNDICIPILAPPPTSNNGLNIPIERWENGTPIGLWGPNKTNPVERSTQFLANGSHLITKFSSGKALYRRGSPTQKIRCSISYFLNSSHLLSRGPLWV